MSGPTFVTEECFRTWDILDQQQAQSQFKVSYGATLMAGVYSFLVVAFAIAFYQLRHSGLHARTKNTLLAYVTIMFIMATAPLVGMLYVTAKYLGTFNEASFLSWNSDFAFNTIQGSCIHRECHNRTIGLALMAEDHHRHPWVIWERRKWVLGVAIVMYMATIATWIVSSIYLGIITAITASACVNFCCTEMIIGKTKLRPRATRNTAAFAQVNQPPTLERLLVVSVESGLAYTALWLILTAAEWTSEIFSFLMQSIMSVVVVLHPTLLVLLLASEKTLLGGNAPIGGTHRSHPSEQYALRHVASPSVSGPYPDDDNATSSGSPKAHGKTLSITSV